MSLQRAIDPIVISDGEPVDATFSGNSQQALRPHQAVLGAVGVAVQVRVDSISHIA